MTEHCNRKLMQWYLVNHWCNLVQALCHNGGAHIGEEVVQEEGVNDNGMHTADGEKKQKLDKRRVVTMTNAGIDPGAVMVHL